jgi:hypothetical protein
LKSSRSPSASLTVSQMSKLMTEAGEVGLNVSIPDRPRGVQISSLVSLRIMTRDTTEASPIGAESHENGYSGYYPSH